MLSPDRQLLASPHAKIRRLVDGTLELETPEAVLTCAGAHAPLLVEILAEAAEPRSAAQLCGGEDGPIRTALARHMVENGALRDVSAFVTASSSDLQLAAYYDLCDSWARDIFIGPFWTTVLSGKATTALMLGWCEQFYHRTVGADEHNEVAVAHCDLPGVKEALTQHFCEEVGHGEIFLEGLEAAGVPRTSVAARPPLESTRQLVDFFTRLGRTDTLAYLACYGVLHSPREGQTLEAVRAQFASLAHAYPEAAPAIRRVGQHAEIDVGAGHDAIVFEPYMLSRPPLRGDEAARVLITVRETVGVFDRYFDGILAAYGADRTA